MPNVKKIMETKQLKTNFNFQLGSGSLAAMAVFEKGFRPNLEVRLPISKALLLLLLLLLLL